MKKILITGEGSYIGTGFRNWIEKYIKNSGNLCYEVSELDMTDSAWKQFDFSKFDAVFHVAGIAHIKETQQNKELYYKVNKELAIETALLARKSGVKQFILLSSMSVFGLTTGHITENTSLNPITNYGKAKLMADEVIQKMNCKDFNVCILRPPMVYGYLCKGNYQTLSKFAKKSPFFPKYENNRSMIYIDFLCEFVRNLVDLSDDEQILNQIYYYPQNVDYVCTFEMIDMIAHIHNRKMLKTKAFNPIIKLFAQKIKVFGKVFGDLTYDSGMSRVKFDYHTCSFDETIKMTEMGKMQ